jgi:hypothetical protein
MDLLIVSGRRPDLLEKTLSSIKNNIDVGFSNVLVNIDPWAGDEHDHKLTKSVILKYHPTAIINEPQVPNFCQAVKFLWTNVKSDYAFHTEDDWIWNQKFTKDYFVNGLQQVGMLRFVTKENRAFDKYGTSPCVMTKHFALETGVLLDINLDPEKQIGSNTMLQEVVTKHKAVCMHGRGISAVDIGRNWRRKKGIEKTIVSGKSVWKQK